MRKARWWMAGSLALGLLVSGAPLKAQYGPQRPGYQDRGGWDVPPRRMNSMEQRGFREGIEGARKDFENHRRPNVNNRDEFRHPDVPHRFRHAYRVGFREGYRVGVRHIYGGPRR